jgi:hypothetical protein
LRRVRAQREARRLQSHLPQPLPFPDRWNHRDDSPGLGYWPGNVVPIGRRVSSNGERDERNDRSPN